MIYFLPLFEVAIQHWLIIDQYGFCHMYLADLHGVPTPLLVILFRGLDPLQFHKKKIVFFLIGYPLRATA